MNNIEQLISDWNICSLDNNVDELFLRSKATISNYMESTETLSHSTIIQIVKDLRSINETDNMYYFTDIILDNILLEHEDLPRQDLTHLFDFIDNCQHIVNQNN